MRDGKGSYINENFIIEGEWKNDLMEGRVRIVTKDAALIAEFN